MGSVYHLKIVRNIHLFRERLSYQDVNAFATMSKGIMGNGDSRLLEKEG